jgi:hypothetical protein
MWTLPRYTEDIKQNWWFRRVRAFMFWLRTRDFSQHAEHARRDQFSERRFTGVSFAKYGPGQIAARVGRERFRGRSPHGASGVTPLVRKRLTQRTNVRFLRQPWFNCSDRREA